MLTKPRRARIVTTGKKRRQVVQMRRHTFPSLGDAADFTARPLFFRKKIANDGYCYVECLLDISYIPAPSSANFFFGPARRADSRSTVIGKFPLPVASPQFMRAGTQGPHKRPENKWPVTRATDIPLTARVARTLSPGLNARPPLNTVLPAPDDSSRRHNDSRITKT